MPDFAGYTDEVQADGWHMRVLDYATPRRLKTDVRAVLIRFAMFLGASLAAYFLIWLLVMCVVRGFFNISI